MLPKLTLPPHLVARHGHDGGVFINGVYHPTMDEMMDYQATREPWGDSIKYGRYTLYFCGVLLALFALLHAFKVATFWAR